MLLQFTQAVKAGTYSTSDISEAFTNIFKPIIFLNMPLSGVQTDQLQDLSFQNI